MTRTAFISGHTDISEEVFNKFYKPRLSTAAITGDNFVTAAAFGADRMCIDYLINVKHIHPQRLTVYLHEKYIERKYPYEEKGIRVKTGFASHLQRDEQMTKDSDYDITWLRSIEEAKLLYGKDWEKDKKSATELNLLRREITT